MLRASNGTPAVLMAIAAAVVVVLVFGSTGTREAKNGPISTIGKSGEMKSPGGSYGSGERLLQMRIF